MMKGRESGGRVVEAAGGERMHTGQLLRQRQDVRLLSEPRGRGDCGGDGQSEDAVLGPLSRQDRHHKTLNFLFLFITDLII